MLKINRIDPIRDRLHPLRNQRRLPRQAHKTSRYLIPATYQDRDESRKVHMFDDYLRTAYVVFQTKSLDDDPHVPQLVKWLLRRIYQRYAWTAMGHDGKSYTKWEFLGIFDTSGGARWAAMVPGGSWMELPLNESLPEETSQFRAHDFPRLSASQEYRDRKLPFVTLPRVDFEALDEKTIQTLNCAHGKCNPKAV